MSDQTPKDTPTKTKPRNILDSDKKAEIEKEIKISFDELKTNNAAEGQLDNSLQMNLSERLDSSTKPIGGLGQKDDGDTTVNVMHQELANKLDISFDSYPSSTKSGQMKGDLIPKESIGVPDKIMTGSIGDGNKAGNLGESRKNDRMSGSRSSSPNKAFLAESTQYAHIKDAGILKKLFDGNEEDITKAQQQLSASEKAAKEINSRVKSKDSEVKEFKANSWKGKQGIEQQVNDLRRKLEEETFIGESLESRQRVIEQENAQIKQDLDPLKKELEEKTEKLKDVREAIKDVTREQRNIETQLIVRTEECAKLEEKGKGFGTISKTLEEAAANFKTTQEKFNEKDQKINKLRELIEQEKPTSNISRKEIEDFRAELQVKLNQMKEVHSVALKENDVLRKEARSVEDRVMSRHDMVSREEQTIKALLALLAKKQREVDQLSRKYDEERKEYENRKREAELGKQLMTRFEKYREEIRERIDHNEFRRTEVAKLLEGLLHETEKFVEDRAIREEKKNTEWKEIDKLEVENIRAKKRFYAKKSGVGIIFGVLFTLLICFTFRYISQ